MLTGRRPSPREDREIELIEEHRGRDGGGMSHGGEPEAYCLWKSLVAGSGVAPGRGTIGSFDAFL